MHDRISTLHEARIPAFCTCLALPTKIPAPDGWPSSSMFGAAAVQSERLRSTTWKDMQANMKSFQSPKSNLN